MRLFNNSYIKLALAGAIIVGTAAAYSTNGVQSMSIEAIASTTNPHLQTTPQPKDQTASAGAATKPATPRTASAPSCQRSSYAQPTAPSVNAAQPGLHQNIQTPGHYTIYGNTSDEINNQMAACTPVGSDGDHYAASTDYAINWAFDFIGDDSGMCHVTSASVGINIAVIYPAWQQTGSAGPNAAWQKFITGLTNHENGHIQIDQNGARQLLADLQNFPVTDCNNIIAQVTAKASASIQAINQNNDNYDASTSHGATQGAVLH